MHTSTADRRPLLRVAGLIASAVIVLSAFLATSAAAMPLEGAPARAAALPRCTIIGTAGKEVLRGTPGNDVICALSGNDRVLGGRGDDTIFGSDGNDRLYGGPGNDRLYGFSGRDRLHGGRGRDLLQGAGGADVLSGGPGADTADYGLRRHGVHVTIGHGADDGSRGEDDEVRADVERVRGGHGDDVLVGDGGPNRLYGGRGNDRLRGGHGKDRLYGGSGRDRLAARDGGTVDSLHCGAGAGDLALADAPDHIARDCERVHRRKHSHPRPHPHRNHAPSSVSLTDRRVAENAPAGTTVGTLRARDRDTRQHHSFALVSGPGGDDNGSFAVDGSRLKTAAVFDYEARRSYSIRARATDDGHPARSVERVITVSITDVDESPTAISLTSASVAENEPAGTAVGTLAAADPDAGDHHAFALVAGAGGEDNGSFSIDGSTLKTAHAFDFESKPSYSIRVRATDAGGLAIERTFTVAVTDTAERPTADAKSVTGVSEDGSKAIELSAADQQGSRLSFAVVSGPHHGTLDTQAPAATCDGARPNHCRASVTYTPDANFNGADSLTFRVDGGSGQSAPATVSIAVDPVDDAPAANDGTAAVDEDDSMLVDLGALVSDLETTDANLTYTIVSQPAHGHAIATGPGATYTPDPDYHGPDSFTYRVTDRGDPDNCSAAPCDGAKTSAIRTISIAVDRVNDTPLAGDGSVSVEEDHAAAVDLTDFASDVETSDSDLTYAVVGAPAHGTLTGSGSSWTYTPDPDYNGADSFTYRVTDRGDPDDCGAPVPGCDPPKTSTTGTVQFTVGAVNDAPVNTVPAGPVTAVQDTDTPIANVSLSDVDAAGDDVQLTLSALHGTLSVATAVLGGVSPLQAVGNGTDTVVVTASLLAIDTTLADAHGLVYRGDAPYTGPDTLTVTTDDLGHNGSGGARSDTDTVALSVVAPNHAPVADGQSVTTVEDSAKTITLTASDADGDDPLSFAIASGAGKGTLGSIGPVACDHATPNSCSADVTYTPNANANGADSFTFTANDGKADSPAATVSIDVTPVDDAPEVRNLEGAALAYTENDPATAITATATVSDIDSANFDTGTLNVDFGAGGTAADRLEIADQGTGAGQIGVSGSNVTLGGTTIGTFTGGTGTTPLVVTLNGNADPAATQALVRAITYRNVSDGPATAARTVRFVLTDGDGATSAPATRGLAVTAVNDAPSLAGIEGGAVAYVESVDSAPSASQVTNALTVADPDDTDLAGATVQITTACRFGEDVLAFTGQNGISGSYNAATCLLTLTGSSSVANYQAALRSVKYENTSDTPDTTTRSVSFQVDDGHAASHASNTQTRDVTVAAANDSPTGAGDTFSGSDSALAGVTLAVSTSSSTPHVSVAGNLLANDIDPDTPHADLTTSAGTSSAQGGVVAVNPDGTFSYTPAPGFTGSDTFTYTVRDNDATAPRTGTGTVTINVGGPHVWFVKPGGSAGNGTSAAPLASLAPLSSGGASDSLDGTGDVIFVYQGTGDATSGGFVLEGDQRLVGQPQGLSVTNANGTYDLVPAGGANPTITNTSGAGLTLADRSTIQRIDVTGASGAGVTGSAIGTLTYGPNTTISGNGGGGLVLSGAAAGAITVDAAIRAGAGHSVSIANRTGGTTSLTGAIDDTGTGISLNSNAGGTINFTGGISASTGADAAFSATGGGTVNVTGSTNTLATTSGTALEVDSTNIGSAGLDFTSISAGTGSGTAGNGIFLNNTGSSGGLTVAGSGTAGSGGTIQHKTGADGTTDGIGIYLNNTSSVSLARMQLDDFDNFAIRGAGVSGFTLSDSTIGGSNGTSAAADEASAAFDNLTGSASITNDNISGGVEDDVRIQNTAGSLSSLSITGSTFATSGAATANDALALLGKSGASAFNATVQGNRFTRAQGDLFQYALESGTGTMHFDSNTVTNDFPTTLPAGGGDINVSSASTASATQSLQYSIDNNDIYSSGTGGQPPNGSVIVVAATPQGSATGTIQDNTIGTTGVTQSGGFDAILADAVKAGFHEVTITGNTIRRYKEAGIRLLGTSPAPSPGYNIRATVKGNLITEPDSVALAGIDAEVGADPADVGTMCLDLGGTTAGDKNSVSSGDPTNFNDINIIQQFATGMNLPGYGGAATDDAAVESFIAGLNNGDGTPTVSAVHDTTATDGNPAGSGFTGTGTGC